MYVGLHLGLIINIKKKKENYFLKATKYLMAEVTVPLVERTSLKSEKLNSKHFSEPLQSKQEVLNLNLLLFKLH